MDNQFTGGSALDTEGQGLNIFFLLGQLNIIAFYHSLPRIFCCPVIANAYYPCGFRLQPTSLRSLFFFFFLLLRVRNVFIAQVVWPSSISSAL